MTSAASEPSSETRRSLPFRLETAIVDPARNRITADGRTRRIEPKVMRVLAVLAAKPGTVIGRDELMHAVWNGIAVGEEVLTRAISELRRALGDDSRAPRFIETVYKTGYRLIPTPEPIAVLPDRRSSAPAIAKRAVPLTAVALLLAWVAIRNSGSSRPPDGDVAAAARTAQVRAFDASALIPVTTFVGHEFFSPFSPDGEAIALVWEGPNGGVVYDLWIKRLDEEEPLQLTDTPGFEDHPAWAPDGDHLAYARHDEDGGIFIKPLIGGAERRLVDRRHGRIEGISFSPDGRFLAFAAEPDGVEPSRLFRLDLTTGDVVALTAPVAGSVGDISPAWSPDGRVIAFDRRHGPMGDEDVYVLDVADFDGGTPPEPRRLTRDREHVNGKAWLADSASLIYAGRRTGYSQLWQLSLDGDLRPLSGSLSRLMIPSVSRDGHRLSFTRKVIEQNIRRAPLDALDAASPWISSTRNDISPTYSPDGSSVAFVSDRSGHSELWRADRDGGNLVRLTGFGGPLLRMPRWSRDGTELIVEAVETGRTALYRVDADRGSTTRWTPGDRNEVFGSFSPDGRQIYFGSDEGGSWQIWRRPAAGGPAEQVTENGGHSAFKTRHGLFFTRRDKAGIWRLTDSGEELVRPDVDSNLGGHWLVSGDGLYFVAQSRHPTIRRLDLVTGEETEVLRLERLGWDDQIFTIDPRGEFIAFGHSDRVESDIWMVELEFL